MHSILPQTQKKLHHKFRKLNLGLMLQLRNQSAVLSLEKPNLSMTEESKASQSSITTMLLTLTMKAFVHQEFAPPGQTINMHYNQVCNV